MPLFAGLRANNQYAKGTMLLGSYPQLVDLDRPNEAMATLKRAIGCLLNATELKPDFGFAWHNLGHAYYYSGSLLTQASNAAEEPDVAQTLKEGSVGSYRNSLTALDQAVRLMPTAADVHNSRGRTLVALHRDDEALEEFEIALELDPSYFKADENKATLKYIQDITGGLHHSGLEGLNVENTDEE